MDPNKILERQKATVASLLHLYEGKEPLHLYLKNYFAKNRQHGSRDRKAIAGLCYSYFRLGQNINRLQQLPSGSSFLEVLGIAGYISGMLPWPGHLEEVTGPNEAHSPLDRFCQVRQHCKTLDLDSLFPFTATTSNGLDLRQFSASMLSQPALFVRIRPVEGARARVMQTLSDHSLLPQQTGEYSLALTSGTPVDKLLDVNKDVVIQDISSQRMAAFLETMLQDRKKRDPARSGKKLKIWDCCAASGGKSLLAWDTFRMAGQKIDLTVSDIRNNILINLDKRFKTAGISGYRKQVLDLTTPGPLPFANSFDLVIADVPCSGSGTWARSPENLIYFDEELIRVFYERQIKIVRKALSAVSPGGYFLYMTCSVFEAENDKIAQMIAQTSGMELVDSKLVTGYEKNGDSMFGALFTRTK